MRLEDIKIEPGATNLNVTALLQSLQFNQFITIFDIEKNDYVFTAHVEQALGFSATEFTEFNLNNRALITGNSKDMKLFLHPDDQPHFERFACLLYQLITEPDIAISPQNDYAILNFRMFNNNGELVRVEHKTFCHSLHDSGLFHAHLDIWTVYPFSPTDLFFPSAQFISNGRQGDINQRLAKIKLRLYGFQLTTAERRVIAMMINGDSRKKIAHQLQVSEGTINSHFNNAKEKINKHLLTAEAAPISSLVQLIHYVRLFQLL
ncbi:MAG: LuxR C-terminal-related transcriptional regulator [Chitinophagales bacterium]